MLPTLPSLFRPLRRTITATLNTLTTLSHPAEQARRKHIKIDDEENASQTLAPHTSTRPLTRAFKMLLLFLLFTLLILSTTAYTIYKPPNVLISYLQKRYPSVIFRIDLSNSKSPGGELEKVVALTIDDAPSPHTMQILDLLAKYNATATFFVIGSQLDSVPDGKKIVQQIHNQGHEVGNHALHDEPSTSLPLPELRRQIQELDTLLPANKLGSKFFRPGSGFFNRGMVKMVEELGYRIALGNVYPHDAQIKSPGWNAGHVLSRVKRGGDVVIMHDRRGYSVEQMGLVLEGLSKRGWRVVSLGEMVEVREKGIRARETSGLV